MNNKVLKKVLSCFLIMIMLFTAVPITASAEAGGTFGDNLTWAFNQSTGLLSITGTGVMPNYDYNNRPWESYEGYIKSVVIGTGVTTIGSYAFYGCDSLTSVTIPDSVTTIRRYAFCSCDSLTSVTIPDNVTTIGSYAFCGDSLTSVTIPDSVTTIGENAFLSCDHLTNITVDADNQYYSSDSYGVLYNKNKTELIQYPIGNERLSFTIPDVVTTIGRYAFSHCSSLTNVTIGDRVTTIGSYAFYGCTSLTSITIPNSVTTIGEDALRECSSLTSVTIGNSVTTIGDYAFCGCDSLISITVPDSVTAIGSCAFFGDSLTCITVDADNQYYSSDSYGVLYNKNKTKLIKYPIGNGRASFIIPDSVTTIGEDAFEFCDSLTSITIGDSVTAIRDSAFHYCKSLTDVYYSGTQEQWNKTSIGSYNGDLTSANIHFESSYNSTVTQENLDYYLKVDDYYKKMSISVTLDENWFTTDSEVYNHDLGGFCSQFTVLGYTTPSHLVEEGEQKPEDYITKNQVLKNALIKMGFSSPEVNLLTERDEVNYFIAHKNITVNGAKKTLVFAGFIGSYHEQWYSNFDPGTGATHKGFEGAKNFVKEKLTAYMDKLNLDRNSTEILLTGHSRGAATANLLAADFIKYEAYAPKENIYTYTFATPNPTTLDETEEKRFERIFNIVNPEDFVTKCMPATWGYSRYGTTYVLPSKTNTEALKYSSLYKNMQSYYSKITNGREYKPYAYGEADTYFVYSSLTAVVKNALMYENIPLFAGAVPMTPKYFFLNTLCHFVSKTATALDFAEAGAIIYATLQNPGSSSVYRNVLLYFLANGTALNPRFEEAHMADTYCAYMMTLPEKELTDDKEAYRNTVNCPVDIEVIDNETGEVVGRIVNNVIDEEIAAKENSVVMTVDGDSKSFWLPGDGDYKVILTGNDNGTMDYTVSEIDSDIGEINRVNFYDVEIENGKTFVGEINADEFVLEEYALETENGETLEADEMLSGDELQSIEINVQADGNGSVTSSMSVTKGDYVTISAEADEGNVFLGWYENNVCISEDETYSFVAKENHSFTAKFKQNKINSVDISDISLDYKASATITPTINADSGVSYTVTYSSSDPGVAYVDENGNVTATGTGTAEITCTVTDENGNVVTDTCEVEVKYNWWQWIIVIVLFGWIWY